ncbi:hypothetical protein [Calothrix sp. PCC 6303]|uniref:hypothetical protein n=1 Tax=Calothrix sp. PCC 6303 TaxID=1170562 RepID=UPI0002A0164B|nr:hypothetical protein [Calothrix sp. PCC 6303]AFY99350.1 hypothetical protein Cal6303_0252 [Calothrix sp. PCC 6303]
MRKIIDVLGIISIAVSPIVLGVAYAQTSVPSIARPVESTTEKNFPLNQPQEVTFELNEKLAETQNLNNPENSATEKEEQLRDWLLLTVLSGKGLSTQEISRSIHDISIIRYDFMRSMANAKLEYGATRSRHIGNGRLVALVPKNQSSEERKKDLAEIADYHRKDIGIKPKVIEVFEYDISANQQLAQITRRGEIDTAKIFSNEYGYYETTITNQDKLKDFLSKTDDITFTQVIDSGLVLGGRKIYRGKDSPKYQVLKVEDIAALYQARQDIDKKSNDFYESDFYKNWSKKTKNLSGDELENAKKPMREEARKNRIVDGSGFSLDWEYNYPGLEKALDEAIPLLKKIKIDGKAVINEQDIKKAKNGLSRKDAEDYFKLVDKIESVWVSEKDKIFKQGEIATEIQKEIKSYQEKEKKNQESINKQIEVYKIERENISNSALSPEEINSKIIELDIIIQELEAKLAEDNTLKKSSEKAEQKTNTRLNYEYKINNLLASKKNNGFQFARYDGDLIRGTEVGMTLFYTDLLMKIFDFNFEKATEETGIKGFRSSTQIPTSPIYKSDRQKEQFVRLWFDPNESGYSSNKVDMNIVFSRHATHIKALASNDSKSKNEVTAPPDTTAFINWWNNHYEEVARYEPQFERLNQIMKWNLIINILSCFQDTSCQKSENFLQSDPLDFLKSIEVNRDNDSFLNWAKKQGKNLKFKKWSQITFIPEGYNDRGKKTDKLKFLDSEKIDERYGKSYPSLYGGVSLGNKMDFADSISLPKDNPLDDIALRSNINPQKTLAYKQEVKPQKGELALKTSEETNIIIKPLGQKTSSIITEPKAGTKIRNLDAELNQFSKFKAVPTQTSNNGLKLTTRLEDAKGISAEFGELNITKTKNGFKTAFESLDIDTGYSLASDLSKHNGDIPSFIASKSDVFPFRYSPSQPNDIYVKLPNSNKSLKLSEGSGGGNGLPPSKSMMTVAEPGKNSRIINVDIVDEAQIPGNAQRFGKGVDFPEEGFNPSQKAQKLSEDPMAFVLSRKLDLQSRIKNMVLRYLLC